MQRGRPPSLRRCATPRAVRCLQAYYILDEVLIGGYLQEVNKREILRICTTQDDMMEEAKEGQSGPIIPSR